MVDEDGCGGVADPMVAVATASATSGGARDRGRPRRLAHTREREEPNESTSAIGANRAFSSWYLPRVSRVIEYKYKPDSTMNNRNTKADVWRRRRRSCARCAKIEILASYWFMYTTNPTRSPSAKSASLSSSSSSTSCIPGSTVAGGCSAMIGQQQRSPWWTTEPPQNHKRERYRARSNVSNVSAP